MRTLTTGTDVGISAIGAEHDVGLMCAFIGRSLTTVADRKAIDQRGKDEHEEGLLEPTSEVDFIPGA
jgi:hypothetical protein